MDTDQYMHYCYGHTPTELQVRLQDNSQNVPLSLDVTSRFFIQLMMLLSANRFKTVTRAGVYWRAAATLQSIEWYDDR
jgi:hypothetical protein